MRRYLLLVVLLAGGAGAVITAQGGTDGAQALSRDWKRISAAGIEAVGNAREGDIQRALREIAAFKSTLDVLMPGLTLTAPEPTSLIVFRDHPSFTEFAPRDGRGRRQMNVGGYFLSAPDRHYLVLPVYTDRQATFQTVFHEFMHFVISRNFRDVPRWLNEGLAEFYSTFEIDRDGNAIVGKAPVWRLRTLRSERMPRLRELLTGETDPRQFQSPDTAMFYAQSWLFVHFMTLSNGGKRQGQILKYLELLPQTKSAEAAAREAFGTTLEGLDSEIIRYAEGFTMPAVRITGVRADALSSASSRLRELEVAALKARLLIELGMDKEAEKYVTRALALDPSDPPSQIASARVRLNLTENADPQAVADLERVAAQHPGDFSAQYFLAHGLYRLERYPEALGAFERCVKINPKAVAPWFGLSLATMAVGRYDQSDSAMAQLQTLHSAPNWHYERSMEAWKKGRYDAALGDARAFIDRAGLGDDSTPYAAFIAAMSARRLGREPEALAILERVVPGIPAKSWPLSVVQFLNGSMSGEALLDKASDNGERTEARYYVAVSLIDVGKREDARKHLEWIRDKGDRNYTEYSMALAELKRLAPETGVRPARTSSDPGGPRRTLQ